jgi:hypothetical protein
MRIKYKNIIKKLLNINKTHNNLQKINYIIKKI